MWNLFSDSCLRNPSPLPYPPHPALCNLDAAGKLTCDDISEGGAAPTAQPPRRFFMKIWKLVIEQVWQSLLKYFKLVFFAQKHLTVVAETNISNILVGRKVGGAWTHWRNKWSVEGKKCEQTKLSFGEMPVIREGITDTHALLSSTHSLLFNAHMLLFHTHAILFGGNHLFARTDTQTHSTHEIYLYRLHKSWA